MDFIPFLRYFFPKPSLPASTPPAPSVTTPTPSHQSVAALLPQEVIDHIFRHFDYNYSLDADWRDSRKRTTGLSRASRVVNSWTAPARRLLFRTVVFELSEDDINLPRRWHELVSSIVGPHIHNLSIVADDFSDSDEEAAAATMRVLAIAPNVRELRLESAPFRQFSDADSATLRSVPCLPRLTTLRLSFRKLRPESVLSDLLATSNRHIERLSYTNTFCYEDRDDSDSEAEEQESNDGSADEQDGEAVEPPPPTGPRLDRWKPSEEVLDFGGNLRFLFINCPLVCLVGRGGVGSMEGLAGLEELTYCESLGEKEEVEELVRAVGRSLVKLDIRGSNAYPDQFVRCQRLAHLHLDQRAVAATFWEEGCLSLAGDFPNSLAHLHIDNDTYLEHTLFHWSKNPSSKPAALVQLTIDHLINDDLFKKLPNLDVLMVPTGHMLERNLQKLQRGQVPFKRLKLFSQSKPLPVRTTPRAPSDDDLSENEADWYAKDLEMDDDPISSDSEDEAEEEKELLGWSLGSTVVQDECDLLEISVFPGSVRYMFEKELDIAEDLMTGPD